MPRRLGLLLLPLLAVPAYAFDVSFEDALAAPESEGAYTFGFALAASGDTIVVGSPGRLPGGAAYVFVRRDGAWEFDTRLEVGPQVSPDGTSSLGTAVAIQGDTILVADPDGDGACGCLAVYAFVADGGQWVLQGKLVPDVRIHGDGYGVSLALRDGIAFVGMPYYGGAGLDQAGAVFLYDGRAGTWDALVRLVEASPWSGQKFGEAVAADGDTALVSSYDTSQGLGHVYVFSRDADTWTEATELVGTDGRGSGGVPLALDGDVAVTLANQGEPPEEMSVLVFRRGPGGWLEEARFGKSSSPGNPIVFGVPLAVSRGLVAAGFFDSEEYVYLYERRGGSWAEVAKVHTAPELLSTPGYASPLALQPGRLVAASISEVKVYSIRRDRGAECDAPGECQSGVCSAGFCCDRECACDGGSADCSGGACTCGGEADGGTAAGGGRGCGCGAARTPGGILAVLVAALALLGARRVSAGAATPRGRGRSRSSGCR